MPRARKQGSSRPAADPSRPCGPLRVTLRDRANLTQLALLVLLISACGKLPSSPTATSGLTPSPTAAPLPTGTAQSTQVSAQTWLAGHLDQVSAERLMADVEALAAIPSRHVNSPGNVDAADYIAGGFADAGVQMRQDEFPLDFRGVAMEQWNVVAVIPGSEPSA